MGAAKRKRARWRTLTFKRRPRKLSKRSETSPETIDENESADSEEIDRLLLSSLRYWEVERDLIEERVAANGSVTVPLSEAESTRSCCTNSRKIATGRVGIAGLC
jgi:hypothetical protein